MWMWFYPGQIKVIFDTPPFCFIDYKKVRLLGNFLTYMCNVNVKCQVCRLFCISVILIQIETPLRGTPVINICTYQLIISFRLIYL